MTTNGRGPLRKHTIIALVEDRPGVLNRIVSKWRQRGFNIESLTVGHSETRGLSRMTFVVDANTDAEQVVKQLDKLVDVVDIRDISAEEMVAREMALIKVAADASNRSQIIEIADIFKAEIVDVSRDAIILEVTGDEEKIDAIFELLQDFGVIELVRTGRVAVIKGSAASHPPPEEHYERYPGGELW
ncbi:MAG TPA: acetolactate synthase small subunit [Dehalococcoidia bacterium]|nr:acetolactate synthase small subunit [Dehalococcoidia bacterium]